MTVNEKFFKVAKEYATIARDSLGSNGKPVTSVKRDNVIAVLTYKFAGTKAFGSGKAVTREFMEQLAQEVDGEYTMTPARIVFNRK
jgi:hypothetical protein